MRDFAVSRADADTVIATAEAGLQRGTDGGRKFATMQAAPMLAVLGWGRADELYGAAPDGKVHLSADAGSRWSG